MSMAYVVKNLCNNYSVLFFIMILVCLRNNFSLEQKHMQDVAQNYPLLKLCTGTVIITYAQKHQDMENYPVLPYTFQ
jgi:hypothetical protein